MHSLPVTRYSLLVTRYSLLVTRYSLLVTLSAIDSDLKRKEKSIFHHCVLKKITPS